MIGPSPVRNAPKLAMREARDLARASSNFARLNVLIAKYVARASIKKLSMRDPKERLTYFTRNVTRYSRRALRLLNFEVKVFGYDDQLMKEKNFLMVGNHMSYTDVMILASVHPTVFVTSVDMGEQFFLGDMAELGGSIFIERRSRSQITQDVKVMADALTDGFNVMVYPEGTSTNGMALLPFKKSLLMAAVDGKRDIMPVVIKYVEINGEPFSLGNCHKVAWFGDMGFVPHFMGLLGLKSVKVELHFLEPIKVTSESTRSELAEKSFAAIEAVYMSDKQPVATAPEKTPETV